MAQAQVDGLRTNLEAHAAFGERRSGSPGDQATAEWIGRRLSSLGFTVETTQSRVPWFETDVAELRTEDAKTGVQPQPLVTATGRHGITGRLVAVRHRAEAAAASNAIALVVTPYARHASIQSPSIEPLISACVDADAAAIVLVTTGPSGEATLLNAPVDKPAAPVPLAILAPRDAEPFVAAGARDAQATLVVSGTAAWRTTPNLIGRLERGPRWLALSTPRTGWFQCAAERGPGVVALLELAEWAASRFPELSIFALNSGGHEYGFIGTHDSMDAAPLPSDTALWVHLGSAMAARDMIEVGGGSLVLPSADSHRILMTTEGMADDARRAFAGLTGLEIPQTIRPGAGELSSICARGYAPAFAVLGVHSWFHTRQDTPETTSAELLAPVIEAHKRLIESTLSRFE